MLFLWRAPLPPFNYCHTTLVMLSLSKHRRQRVAVVTGYAIAPVFLLAQKHKPLARLPSTWLTHLVQSALIIANAFQALSLQKIKTLCIFTTLDLTTGF